MKRVYIVDDESSVRRSTHFLLATHGYEPWAFANAGDFLAALADLAPGCVLLDIRMPNVDGIQLLAQIETELDRLSVIMVTGHADIETAVRAMKQGAIELLQKPVSEAALIGALEAGFQRLARGAAARDKVGEAVAAIGRLSSREREVLQRLMTGMSNKVVAYDLGLSPRTVEMYRVNLLRKLGVKKLPEAVRIADQADLPPLTSNYQGSVL